MFVRVTTLMVKLEKIEEGIGIYKNSVVPAAKKQKGFAAAYLLADRKTGKAVSLTFWQSEEDALDNERNRYYQEQLVKFINLLQAPPIREGYEIVVKALARK
ncbi:MAG: antibiotic biosynthesis monooxygenase family protein [Candidatus Aminicenantales bacterium]